MGDISGRIKVIESDITTLDINAIVNAANRSSMGGGPVHGNTIHNADPIFIGVFE